MTYFVEEGVPHLSRNPTQARCIGTPNLQVLVHWRGVESSQARSLRLMTCQCPVTKTKDWMEL